MKFVNLCCAALLASAAPALAQDYPTRNITLVVPLGAGGSADVVGRLLAQSMSETLGRAIVVENVLGAGGMLGASRVAKASPDGYQILLGTVGTQAQNQTLYKTPLYDATRDFEPVGLAVDVPIILQVKKEFPADTFTDVIAYIKANADKLSFGSPGAGSSNHLACVLFNAAIGVPVTHVPYRAAAELFQDMVAGRLDYWCPTTTAAAPLAKVKTIATFSAQPLWCYRAQDCGKGAAKFRGRDLDWTLPSEGHAARNHQDAQRCAWKSAGQSCRARKAWPDRRRCRGRRSTARPNTSASMWRVK